MRNSNICCFKRAPWMFVFLFITFISGCGTDDATIDNKPPVISNLLPENNLLIKDVSSILLKADITDPDGSIVKVSFIINGQIVGEVTTEPFQFDWTPTSSGNYTLQIIVTDNDGGVAESGASQFTAVGFSCSKDASSSGFTPKSINNVVMAFYPFWNTSTYPIAEIPWDKITHINYSFALPNEDGTLNTQDIDSEIDNLVTAAHANGVKVYVSVGGAIGGEGFVSVSANTRLRALFVDEINCYVINHFLDGVDIDWEYWTGQDQIVATESAGLVDLLKDLRDELDEDKEMSMDVFATNWNGKHYRDEAVQYLTYINAMLYDLRGPWSEAGHQSAYDEVITTGATTFTIKSWGLEYWAGFRKWPIPKIVVGMPFYGRDFDVNDGAAVAYKDVVQRVQDEGADLDADRIGNLYYDSPASARKKAIFARDNGYAGMMFWELTLDTKDAETSLLNVLDQELR